MIAFMGSLFLFVYWPSFNSALQSSTGQQRAIVNTYLSIAASALVSTVYSKLYYGKIDMMITQNSTLAGGVAIGSTCDMISEPGIALLIGALAGLISGFGITHLHPWLQKKMYLHDTCGVHFIHGVPGLIAWLLSIIVTGSLNKSNYLNSYEAKYGGQYGLLASENDWEFPQRQFMAGLITLFFAIVGGLSCGWFASRDFMGEPKLLF